MTGMISTAGRPPLAWAGVRHQIMDAGSIDGEKNVKETDQEFGEYLCPPFLFLVD
jgi:hypothetical protein